MSHAKNLSNDQLGLLVTDRRKFYVGEQATKELWTSVAPFTTIISNKGTTNVPDPDYRMFEHRSGFVRQEMTIDEGAANWDSDGAPGDSTATARKVKNKKGLGSNSDADDSVISLVFEAWNEGDFLGVVTPTGVGSDGKVTYQSLGNPRSSDNKAKNMPQGTKLVVAGSAIGEGQTSPEAHHDELETVHNSSQIFRTPMEITGTLHEAALRGYSNELARMRMEKNREHKMQKERAFLMGTRAAGIKDNPFSGTAHTKDQDGKIRRTTMGAITALYRHGSADETDDDQSLFRRAMASYNNSKFIDDMEKVFWYVPTSGYKTAICGPGAMSFWSKIATDGFMKGTQKVTISDLQLDKLKFYFKWLETPHGMIKLVQAPALRHEYRNHMLILDESNIGHTKYRNSYYATNIKTENNYDGQKDEYFSDEGVKIQLIETHKLFIFS